MRVGEPFNPWRGACGFYPSDTVGRQTKLSDREGIVRVVTDGQKRVYERLTRFAGRDGHCYPALRTLSEVLGKSDRQIKRDVAALESFGLIGHRFRDGRRSNTYVFLWHSIFEGTPTSSQSKATSQDVRSREDMDGKLRGHIGQFEGTPTSYELSQELYTGNSSSAIEQVQQPADTDQADDEPYSFEIANALMAAFRSVGVPPPSGRCPEERIRGLLQVAGIPEIELARFFEDYRTKWTNGPPATWGHTVKAIERWAADPDTHERIESAARARETLREVAMRQVDIKRQWDEPISITDAIRFWERHSSGECLPNALQSYLMRRFAGQKVTPNFVKAERSRWGKTPCSACRGCGLVGTAIAKTLRYCSCEWGKNWGELEPNHPSEEIARVHQSLRSRLIAALREVGEDFTADAVEGDSVGKPAPIFETEAEVIIDGEKSFLIPFVESLESLPANWQKLPVLLGESRVIRPRFHDSAFGAWETLPLASLAA